MTWTTAELLGQMNAWLWPFFRIGSMLALAPVFGSVYVPIRARLGLALALSVVVVPLLPAPPAVSALSAEGLLITAQQVVTGMALGFALRLVFVIFELAGQAISQPMGLGFAAMVDPVTGVQVPVLSQFYIVLGTLVFLALNGHLLFIRFIVESFTLVPVSVHGLGADGLWRLVRQMVWAMAWALLVALPAITALLVVNFSFAVMTRSAPQLNIFAVGFPTALVLGFLIMFVTLPGVFSQVDRIFDEALAFMRGLAAGGP